MLKHPLKAFSEGFENVDVKTPPTGTGKTLEYELVINNPSCKLLITESFPSRGKNRKDFFTEIMRAYDEDKPLDELKALSSHEKIKESIDSSNWNNADKKILMEGDYSCEKDIHLPGSYTSCCGGILWLQRRSCSTDIQPIRRYVRTNRC